VAGTDLGPVVEAIIASRDLPRSVDFYRRGIGWEVLEDAGDGVVMGVPGTETGKIRLVRAAADSNLPAPEIWEIGPRLLGIYASDLARSQEQIRAAGGWSGPIIGYDLEGHQAARLYKPGGPAYPVEILARSTDADDLILTIPGYPERYPTPALEREPDRTHSELHSGVVVVEDVDQALAVFHEAGGMELILDVVVGGPEVEELCTLPPGGSLRIGFVAGEGRAPGRIELLQFYGCPPAPYRNRPVGLRRLAFVVADPDGMADRLAAAGAEKLGPGLLRGPGHIEIELRPDARTRPPGAAAVGEPASLGG
jgi:catechol 2,3-dioxygenase-like lactoylglutathione lyase family enzyme